MVGKIGIIDAHTHIPPEWAELAVRVMDRSGVEASVTLGWQDAFGERLDRMLAVFGRWPGRFAQLANIDWSRVDSPDFGKDAADELERGVERGARGLKIFKNLGLEVGPRRVNCCAWMTPVSTRCSSAQDG